LGLVAAQVLVCFTIRALKKRATVPKQSLGDGVRIHVRVSEAIAVKSKHQTIGRTVLYNHDSRGCLIGNGH
jgi:hypothetical protein